MNGQDIPGFYFDRDKGKYFQITADPGFKHSSENVKKQKKEEEAKQVEARHTKRRKKETVVVRHATSFLSRAYLERETGYSTHSHLMQLWPSASASGFEGKQLVKPGSVRYFDRDPKLNCLYSVVNDNLVQRQYLEKESSSQDDDESPPFSAESSKREYEPPERLACMTSTVSSLNHLHASGALVVTTYGSNRPAVVYLTDPSRNGPYIGELFTPHHWPVIWTSSPRPAFSVSETNTIPATNTELIAVGASKDLLLMSRSPAGSWDCSTALQTESDVLALEWISPTTLCLGHRDGEIRIYDSRSRGSTHILTHSTPISQLRRADDFTRLVCAGVCDTLHLYDMRMGGTIPPPPRKVERINRTLPYEHRASKPLLSFAYSNNDTPDLGIDVHHRLRLIAAADDENNIKLYNMFTGQPARTLSTNMEMFAQSDSKELIRYSKRLRSVRFYEDEGGDVSLWAAVMGGVTRYAW